MYNASQKLYKFCNVLWEEVLLRGRYILSDNPLCSVEDCHSRLSVNDEIKKYECLICGKQYLYSQYRNHLEVYSLVRLKLEGHKTRNYQIESLDLPPTKVSGKAEDDNYWVKAKIGEKNGKRMAVVYFGKKDSKTQTPEDYVQLFLDFDDEQLRSDRSNKNPMKLMAKLTAEFEDSVTEMSKK